MWIGLLLVLSTSYQIQHAQNSRRAEAGVSKVLPRGLFCVPWGAMSTLINGPDSPHLNGISSIAAAPARRPVKPR